MPIYVYECENGHQVELVRAVVDRDAPVICHEPFCPRRAQRVPTAAAFLGFAEPKESNVSRAIRKVKERGL